ncbi:MAG: YbaN family protein [Pseudomonadota bacterium]
MRMVWAFCGILCLCLGAVGAILPLLPTVPFMLLAAFCFARSSPQLHQWLLSHPVFGPAIIDWQERGAISLRAKRAATVSIAAVFGLSLLLGVGFAVLAIQAVVLSAVLTFIWTRPAA